MGGSSKLRSSVSDNPRTIFSKSRIASSILGLDSGMCCVIVSASGFKNSKAGSF